ncbi:MAG: hypothetical protein ACREBF_02355, partial [Candidatus Micrarchaeales archaeon]
FMLSIQINAIIFGMASFLLQNIMPYFGIYIILPSAIVMFFTLIEMGSDHIVERAYLEELRQSGFQVF